MFEWHKQYPTSEEKNECLFACLFVFLSFFLSFILFIFLSQEHEINVFNQRVMFRFFLSELPGHNVICHVD